MPFSASTGKKKEALILTKIKCSRFDVKVNELSSRDPASSHESLPQGNFGDRPFFGDVLSDNNSETRLIKSATGHKSDH